MTVFDLLEKYFSQPILPGTTLTEIRSLANIPENSVWRVASGCIHQFSMKREMTDYVWRNGQFETFDGERANFNPSMTGSLSRFDATWFQGILE